MDIRRIVGRNLRRLRLDRGLSQEALAHDAGMAPSFLSQIENGKRSVTITKLQEIATALRVPIIEFFADAKAGAAKDIVNSRRIRRPRGS